ncbi:hypothetical protein CYMTET_40680 [Cymbomonas tetramitiformis]|uniref:Uncharacterized protein n=1 Tax=Cymbomonas tetramitiformis TaxID=36881 RepID=A0AAE0C7L3_9CHLO|nr:hypothetical protein CYMTET_40680 [Cymbomonas tetramitiformis]
MTSASVASDFVDIKSAAVKFNVTPRIIQNWDKKKWIETCETDTGKLYNLLTYSQFRQADANNALTSDDFEDWKTGITKTFKWIHDNVKDEATRSTFMMEFGKVSKWVGFSQEGNAKVCLKNEYKEGVDYILEPDFTHLNMAGVMPRRGIREIILLTVDCFKQFCIQAKTARGRSVRDYYINLEKRFLDGELTYAAEVVQNYDDKHGTRSQVTITTVDRELPEHGIHQFNEIAQVKEWLDSIKQSRETSVNLTNIAKKTVSPALTFLTCIQTIINDAIFGFFDKGFNNTQEFLTAYGMDAKSGAAACMIKEQLEYRKSLAKLVWTFIDKHPGATKEDVTQYAESRAGRIYELVAELGCNKLFKPADENCNSMLTYAERRRLRSKGRDVAPAPLEATMTNERKRKLDVDPDNELPKEDTRVRRARKMSMYENGAGC